MTQSRYALSEQARKIRRDNVIELLSSGCTRHREIAEKLNISVRTVDRDAKYWLEVSDEEMHQHFKTLPLEIKKCMVLIDLTIKMLTEIIQSPDTEVDIRLEASRDRMQALKFKMDLLDGKARLREVYGFLDSHNKTLT